MVGGTLRGLRVVEFAGLGPAPFACMQLADMGAEVVTIERPQARIGDARNIVRRGRSVVPLDLKTPEGKDQARMLVDHADVLVEGFRPGVMERIGLGPDTALERNPRLVYARMTGWGQEGPLAHTAGHDINYIALSGALHAIGPRERPVPPLNLLGDYGGGSLYLVTGILAALFERQRSGCGQVVDAAIVDGAVSLMTQFVGMKLRGTFVEERESNMLDGAAPYYTVYETADGRHVAVGAIEPQFFAKLCERIGLEPVWIEARNDRSRWPELRQGLAAVFRSRARDEWAALLQDTDCCVSPVLSLGEVEQHPHNMMRNALVQVERVAQPAPAPRFSRTPSRARPVASAAETCADVIARWTTDQASS
jgi:alpha-methylacyl-CoA racemase